MQSRIETRITKEYRIETEDIREAIYEYFIKKGVEGIFQPSHISIVCLSNEFADSIDLEATLKLTQTSVI